MASSDTTLEFKKGDAIISNGKVFIITKVKDKKNIEGKTEPYIFYKPYFENKRNKSMICSLPMSSFAKTNKRKPISTEKLKELIELMTKKVAKKDKLPVNQAKEVLKTNNPVKITKLMKNLWIIKQDPEDKLSHTDRNILKRATELLSQEFAFVKKTTQDAAIESIQKYLNS